MSAIYSRQTQRLYHVPERGRVTLRIASPERPPRMPSAPVQRVIYCPWQTASWVAVGLCLFGWAWLVAN